MPQAAHISIISPALRSWVNERSLSCMNNRVQRFGDETRTDLREHLSRVRVRIEQSKVRRLYELREDYWHSAYRCYGAEQVNFTGCDGLVWEFAACCVLLDDVWVAAGDQEEVKRLEGELKHWLNWEPEPEQLTLW